MSEEQKLKRIGPRERHAIALTVSTNRRMRENWEREAMRRKGKGVCIWCGAEPCGHLWASPSSPEPGGERCCERCSHEPVEGWQHTHTAWDGDAHYPVCAVTMKEGDVVYMRRDGVVQILEMRAPAPSSLEDAATTEDVPTAAFFGRDGGVALYRAGEGGPEHTNLWEKKHDLDVLWLQIRVQSAVAKSREFQKRLEERLAAELAEKERIDAERQEAERKKLEADIERRNLQHETKTVLIEMEKQGLGEDDELVLEDDVSEEVPELAAAAEAPAPVVEEPKRLTLAELKKPVPPKKGPGRPKRSARQRDARKRQKRAWARQEAKARLEVKRLERLSRARGETLVKEEDP